MIAIALIAHGGKADAVAAVPVNFAGYSPDCGVHADTKDERLTIEWNAGIERIRAVISLEAGRPLFESLALAARPTRDFVPILTQVEPEFFLTVGSRVTPPGKPSNQKWIVFFDSPAKRPHQSFLLERSTTSARVESRGKRLSVILPSVSGGGFTGEIVLTVYDESPLLHLEAVVSTNNDLRAIIYGAGLGWSVDRKNATRYAWMDTDGGWHRTEAANDLADQSFPIRHRTIIAETAGGSVAAFPPPHQFQFPRDLSNNFRQVYAGNRHAGLSSRTGYGIRQDKNQGGNFVPWFNAPPGTEQRLGVFFLLVPDNVEAAMSKVLRYTHGDRFVKMPGRLTMTSHWHMAIAETAMKQRAAGASQLPIPDFVKIFKDFGVDMVHLAEFHGDGHQFDEGPLRLPEVEAMFAECKRLSDDKLLLIPGEEVNTFLGIEEPGKHPGHWMSLFPRPVYWTMKRPAGKPFVEDHPTYGKVYRVGSRQDMVKLFELENGLAWSAHPRIKASSWTPDIFRQDDSIWPTYGWAGPGSRCRRTSRATASASACSICSATWRIGDKRSTSWARSTSSRSTARTNSIHI